MEGLRDTAEPTIEAEDPAERSSPQHRQANEEPGFLQPGRLNRVGLDYEPVHKTQEDRQGNGEAKAQRAQRLKRGGAALWR
jgi:hypothetical protein